MSNIKRENKLNGLYIVCTYIFQVNLEVVSYKFAICLSSCFNLHL